MSIPVVSDILNTLRDVIKWFISSAPKPIQLMVFFLMFSIVGFLIPGMLNTFGYHCDSNMNVVKVDGFNVFTNFDLWASKPNTDPELNYSLRVDEQCLAVFDYNDTFNSGLGYSGALCTDCDNVQGICTGDGYRKPWTGWWQKTWCGWAGCAPPEGYYYDWDLYLSQGDHYFVCYEDDCDQTIFAEEDRIWDKKLEEAGATLYYTDQTQYSYERMLQIQCTGKLEPYVTFFGINLFDFRIWVFIAMMMFILWVIRHKAHTG